MGKSVVRICSVVFLLLMICASCIASSVNKAVTIVRFTQPGVMPDVSDAWYEEVANKVNTKLKAYGVEAESSKLAWEEYATTHLNEKVDKALVNEEWNEVLRSKYDTKVDVFVDRYAKNRDGTSDIMLEIVISAMDNGRVLSHGAFDNSKVEKPRKEALEYAIDEVMAGFEGFFGK